MLEKQEGRRLQDLRCDAIFLRDLLLAVDVDFGEGDFVRSGEACGELFVYGGDLLAWTALVSIDYVVGLSASTSVVVMRDSVKLGVRICVMVGQVVGQMKTVR